MLISDSPKYSCDMISVQDGCNICFYVRYSVTMIQIKWKMKTSEVE